MGKRRLNQEKGSAIIVLIMVIAFLLTVGILLLFVTGTGPEVAGNIRQQERAFNAAEAGFDAVWRVLNENIISGMITDFSAQYRTDYNGQPVLDLPPTDNSPNPYYFRALTDEELIADFERDPANVLFLNEPLPNDPSLSYTVFLINDEAGGGTPNDRDCLVVCIGRAGRNTYARIEVLIEIQEST
ncbi:MAG: pilus assembly PilX family protein [Candidatus Aminicenantales bacterium]